MGGHRELWWIEEDDGGSRKVTVTFQSPLPALNKGRSPGETPEDHRKNETYYSHYWPDDPHDYVGSKRGFPQRRNNARNTFADRKLGVKGGLVGILDKLRDHPELGPSPPPFDLKPPGAFDPPAPVPEGTGRTVPVAPARGAAVMGGQAPVAPKPLSKASSSSAARVGRAVRQATQHCPDLLQPGAKFQRKGQTYEIDCHDRMQSTTGGECHCKVASLLMYCKCDWQIIHRSKQMTSEQLRKLLDRNIEVLEEAHAEYSRCDVEKALGQANAAVDKAMRKAIARAEVHC